MNYRPHGDCILVRVEPVEERGPIFLPNGSSRVRTGNVISVGPGRHNKRGKRLPMDVAAGERIAFFRENLEHQQGKQLVRALAHIGEDIGLLRQSDVLFVVPPDWVGTLS